MKRLWLIILTLNLVSCSGLDTVDLPTNENLIVVEGWIYDTAGPHEVKLSRSVPFYSNNSSDKISDALVSVIDNVGRRELLTETAPGIYHTSVNFKGVVGSSYFVEIIMPDGSTYQSEKELLKPVPEIDSINFVEEIIFDTETIEEISVFYPVVYVDEPATNSDFYRWKVYENGELLNEPEEIILLTDRFINGNNFQNELRDFQFLEEDSVKIELLSITQQAYDFFRLFVKQSTDLGTASGTSPTILRGNLFNTDDEDEVVLGYFGASSLSTIESSITE